MAPFYSYSSLALPRSAASSSDRPEPCPDRVSPGGSPVRDVRTFREVGRPSQLPSTPPQGTTVRRHEPGLVMVSRKPSFRDSMSNSSLPPGVSAPRLERGCGASRIKFDLDRH